MCETLECRVITRKLRGFRDLTHIDRESIDSRSAVVPKPFLCNNNAIPPNKLDKCNFKWNWNTMGSWRIYFLLVSLSFSLKIGIITHLARVFQLSLLLDSPATE